MSDRMIPVPEDLLRRLRNYALFARTADPESVGDDVADVRALLAGPSVPAREPAEERRAEYRRLLTEYHRLGDWLMEHPLEAAFMPDLLKPVDPDAGLSGQEGNQP